MATPVIVTAAAIATAVLGGTWAAVNRAVFGPRRCQRSAPSPRH
jgi:hypothetical protein